MLAAGSRWWKDFVATDCPVIGPAVHPRAQMSIADGHTLFTSESVTEGHPHKLFDAVADAVLDVPTTAPAAG